jgi:hypothetical protein
MCAKYTVGDHCVLLEAVTVKLGSRLVESNFDCHCKLQGGSNMTGTNCDLFTHK